MTRGEISGRVDVNYWRLTPLYRDLFSRPRFPALPVGTLVELVQYGSSSPATEEPIGVPMLRMNNLQNDGWDLSELKYIQMSEEEVERFRLEPGDLLFNRTNSKELVGKCEMFGESGDWVFASYLIRVRLDSAKVLPRFACDFLNTRAGRLQIDRLSRQIIGMTNINAEELKEVHVPVPPDTNTQMTLVAAMDAARSERQAKLAEADSLLAGLDDSLLATLGIATPHKDDRKVFAVCHSELRANQIGANLYAPALQMYLRALSTGRFPTGKLGDEVSVNPSVSLEGISDDSPVSFVPMDAVEDKAAGGLTLRDRELADVKRGYTPFADGDVLWAKITPCMENGKSGIARGLTNGVGFGSTEFHVLRPLSTRVTAEYVHEFISQSGLRLAARSAFTGSAGHQRVPAEFLEQLPFPVPPLDVQASIAADARRRRETARGLRAEAEAGWKAAKRWFEEQLLGPLTP